MTTKARKQKAKAKRSHSTKSSRYTVFISHSSKDIFIAEGIAEKIEKTGAGYRLDKRDFEGGKNIRDEISRGVSESHEVIVLFSPNSKAAKWVILEVGVAQGKKRHLTPILYSVEPKDEDLEIISGMIAIDLNQDFNKYLTDLKKRMDKWKKRKK